MGYFNRDNPPKTITFIPNFNGCAPQAPPHTSTLNLWELKDKTSQLPMTKAAFAGSDSNSPQVKTEIKYFVCVLKGKD